MKTIEQHLQDLFIGKVVKIKYIETFDDDLKPIYNTLIGLVKSYELAVCDFSPDTHVIAIDGYHSNIVIQSNEYDVGIEILTT